MSATKSDKVRLTGASGLLGVAAIEKFLFAGREVVGVSRQTCPSWLMNTARRRRAKRRGKSIPTVTPRSCESLEDAFNPVDTDVGIFLADDLRVFETGRLNECGQLVEAVELNDDDPPRRRLPGNRSWLTAAHNVSAAGVCNRLCARGQKFLHVCVLIDHIHFRNDECRRL